MSFSQTLKLALTLAPKILAGHWRVEPRRNGAISCNRADKITPGS